MAPEIWFGICALALGLVLAVNAAWVNRRVRRIDARTGLAMRRTSRRRRAMTKPDDPR